MRDTIREFCDPLYPYRIVVGLADTQPSKCKQMEKDLNLEKSINMARQLEEIKKQQNTLRSDASGVKQMLCGQSV